MRGRIIKRKGSSNYTIVLQLGLDPVSGKIHCVNLATEEILTLCDDRKSIQQIAHELSKKYDATRLTIEEDCIAFLKSLSREGYVLF